MNKNNILLLIFSILLPLPLFAQDDLPEIDPIAVIVSTGEETTAYSGDAPLTVTFKPQEKNVGSLTDYYEWRFYDDGGTPDEPYLIRHEKETTVEFTRAGKHNVVVYAYFVNGADTIKSFKYDGYWDNKDPLTIEIFESKLEMPNAFSPNGDGTNDTYKAKKGYRSIIWFHATIYNRWGQKLYEWNDVGGEWDGRFNGSYVKDGVYFCHVQARGADGRVYDIKRDVNVLKGLNAPTE